MCFDLLVYHYTGSLDDPCKLHCRRLSGRQGIEASEPTDLTADVVICGARDSQNVVFSPGESKRLEEFCSAKDSLLGLQGLVRPGEDQLLQHECT